MAVSEVAPLHTECTEDEEGHRTYASVFQVITDNRLDGPVTAKNAAGIPVRGSQYQWGTDVDAWAFCVTRTAKLKAADQSKKVWLVTATHSTKHGKQCSELTIENPLEMPPVIGGSFLSVAKAADKDQDGKPLLNSSDEEFLPKPEIDSQYDTLTWEVNTPTIDLEKRASFRDSVNDAELWGLPKRCVRLMQWSYTIAYYGQCQSYVKNNLEFSIRDEDEPWNEEFLDIGTRTLGPIKGGVRTYNVILENDLIAGRVPLNGNGQRLSDEDRQAGLYKYRTFKILKERDYTKLPIVDPIPGPFV